MLTVLWHDSEAKGFTDLIPEDWFSEEGTVKNTVHRVEGPHSEAYKAKCNVKVSGILAELDYAAFRKFNTKQGMSLGVMRLQFTDQDRRTVSQVFWKGLDAGEFLPASTTVGQMNETPGSSEAWFPEELPEGATCREGSVQRVLVNRYERDRQAREACIRHHGASCAVCAFDFGTVYGADYAGFIHVHHLRPLSDGGGEYVVDPITDLVPVCPNCHAIIHHGGRVRSIDEVRELLGKKGREKECHAPMR
jgi:predicted HNH restriction endonuclease